MLFNPVCWAEERNKALCKNDNDYHYQKVMLKLQVGLEKFSFSLLKSKRARKFQKRTSKEVTD
ncbi:MAG: hypothetical protein CMD92_02425 [Gammaproteobacteria bacterium]|nr:hypothetical protein [Gammaproteobacteria bacterium]